MTTWAIVNQKGGVGKTAVTLGLGAALAHLGKRVLLVDLDPQASATKVVGAEDTTYTMTDILLSTSALSITDVAVPAEQWGFDIAPSAIELARREQGREMGDEQKLRKALINNPYDVVLVDCPPSLGVLTANSLVAASYVLIVSTPTYAAMRGLRELLLGSDVKEAGRQVHLPSTIEAVKENYNADLEVAGHVINLMDPTRDAKAHLSEMLGVQEAIGPVWDPPIPRRAAMNESYTSGVPLYNADSPTAGSRELVAAFENLALRLLDIQYTPLEGPDAARVRDLPVRRLRYWIGDAAEPTIVPELDGDQIVDAPEDDGT